MAFAELRGPQAPLDRFTEGSDRAVGSLSGLSEGFDRALFRYLGFRRGLTEALFDTSNWWRVRPVRCSVSWLFGGG